MKLNNCKEIVTNILAQRQDMRDNDISLIILVWKIQAEKYGIEDLEGCSAGMLFGLMLDKKVAHPSSIKRIRAKLQQTHKHLRGAKYEKRHKHQENIMDELMTIDAEASGPSY